ncbi:tyrosine-type recombinase/integrase [Paenibacillus alba]|uniref:tyrosine-type recombinase/integrase n=1 Tax=Paenibacillus alba TaxID=1197127 RepID=UPI00156619F1|nr:tyrosine-type recombinase/integrase [Paenibacillus alba]NQX68473.1 tyrosine-type recombinase/integrase [Paenibacillus alba]
MNFVQPIREKETIEAIKEYLMKRSHRNYMMFVFGINTGLRIQDILKMRVKDVSGDHLFMNEMKTGKRKIIEINPTLKREIKRYASSMKEEDFLFPSRQGDGDPIKRDMAYKIMKAAAKKFKLKDIGTHTLRKTFGYHMYQMKKDITLVQKLLNHSDKAITMRYIGLDQDAMNEAMRGFGL